MGARWYEAEKEGEKNVFYHGESWKGDSEGEFPIFIYAAPAQTTKGAEDTLHKFTVFLTFGVFDGRG